VRRSPKRCSRRPPTRIVIIDRDLNIVGSSPESEQIYGYPETGRRGHTGLNIIDDRDRPDVEAACARPSRSTKW